MRRTGAGVVLIFNLIFHRYVYRRSVTQNFLMHIATLHALILRIPLQISWHALIIQVKTSTMTNFVQSEFGEISFDLIRYHMFPIVLIKCLRARKFTPQGTAYQKACMRMSSRKHSACGAISPTRTLATRLAGQSSRSHALGINGGGTLPSAYGLSVVVGKLSATWLAVGLTKLYLVVRSTS